VLLKPLIDLHGEPRNWATAARLYVDTLADIPEHLLAIAVRHAIASNPYFPKPGDLRASIADELSDYRRRRDEAALAALPKPPERELPTEEDFVAVHETLAPLLAEMSGRARLFRGEEKPLAQVVPGEVDHLRDTLRQRSNGRRDDHLGCPAYPNCSDDPSRCALRGPVDDDDIPGHRG
jgi:hypothetical protein